MTPRRLRWIRAQRDRLHESLRRRLIDLYRPPCLLPCCCHRLWYWFVHHFASLPVIAEMEGESQASLVGLGLFMEPLTAIGQLYGVLRICELERLVASGVVRRVWLDRPVRLAVDQVKTAGGAVCAPRDATGKGITIAIVDTGIYPHPDLRMRVVGWVDLVRRRSKPYDDHGHGTHLAGCAAGDGSCSGGRYRGMAPRALLVGVKVLDRRGAGRLSTLLSGIDWVIRYRSRYAIRVLCLGAPIESADDPLAHGLKRAWRAGLTIAATGGPAIAPAGVISLRAPGSWLDRQRPRSRVERWYATTPGIAEAAPIRAGLVALLLEREPWLDPDGVRDRLLAGWGIELGGSPGG